MGHFPWEKKKKSRRAFISSTVLWLQSKISLVTYRNWSRHIAPIFIIIWKEKSPRLNVLLFAFRTTGIVLMLEQNSLVAILPHTSKPARHYYLMKWKKKLSELYKVNSFKIKRPHIVQEMCYFLKNTQFTKQTFALEFLFNTKMWSRKDSIINS